MELIISIGLFIFGIVFLFYLPGRYSIKLLKIKLNSSENVFVSIVFGILIFTLVSLIFSFLKIYLFALLLIAILDIIAIKHKTLPKIKFSKANTLQYAMLGAMVLVFSIPMITSGYAEDSVRLIGVNNYDGLWYLSLINELRFNFPPQHPGFSGELLTGYHFLLFFLMGKVGSIFNISTINLMFKIFPVFVAALWAIGVYVLILDWSKNKVASLLAVFFTMFGGSFVYITHLEGHSDISLDSGYGILQPATSLVNPTFAISIVFMTAFLFCAHRYLRSKNAGWLVPITLIVGLTPLFKVYGGIIILGGFILLVAYDILKRKFLILPSLIGVTILFFSVYWPFTDRSAHLIFHPFWAPHNVLRDNFPWYGYDEKIRTYSQLGVIKGLVATEFYAFYIFLIGNLGSRVVGLVLGAIKLIKEKKPPSIFSLLVFSMAVASILIPLLFIQSGKVFETIQFAWYFLFLTSLFSALGLGWLFTLKFNVLLKSVLLIVIIVATIPSALEALIGYSTPGSLVEKNYYDSTQFLADKGSYDEIVLELPAQHVGTSYKALKKNYRSGRPMIPALANKRSFLSYEYFNFEGLDVEGRIMFLNKILILENELDQENMDSVTNLQKTISQGLNFYDVRYIHSPVPLRWVSLFDNIKEIYSNPKAYIYEIQ